MRSYNLVAMHVRDHGPIQRNMWETAVERNGDDLYDVWRLLLQVQYASGEEKQYW